MKIFSVNEADMYMASTLDEAITTALDLGGVDAVEREHSAEVPDSELDRLMFTDGDGSKRTFREELARRDPVPQFFASSEF